MPWPSLLCVLLCLLPFAGVGQSLVRNGSFEDQAACPKRLGDIQMAFDWYRVAETPDLFSACNGPAGFLGVPGNYKGTRAAQEGSAYAGLALFYTGDALTPRQAYEVGESIYNVLAQPTAAGCVYDLSLWACLADSSHYTADAVTLTLTNAELTENQTAANTQVISLPMGASGQPGWAQLSARFVATGKWTFLILGCSRNAFSFRAYQHSLWHNRRRTPRPHQLAICYYYFDNLALLQHGPNTTLNAH
jgi:hypothetical protein